MNFKRIVRVFCLIVKIWRWYQASRIDQAAKDKFIVRCEKARAYAENKLKIKVECSERVGDFYYLMGTYPNGSPYKLEMQKGK